MFYVAIGRVVSSRLPSNVLVFVGVEKGQVLKIFENFFFFFFENLLFIAGEGNKAVDGVWSWCSGGKLTDEGKPGS